MAKFKELNKLRKPARITVTVQLDGQLAEREAKLRRAIAQARQAEAMAGASLADGPPENIVDLEQQLHQLREEAATTMVDFTFQAISYAGLEELRYKHPPAERHQVEGLAWDPDTFGPALLAACAVDPELTDEEALQVWQEWSPGLVNTLYRAAWDVCNGSPVVRPLSNASSARTQPSEQASAIAVVEASPVAGG